MAKTLLEQWRSTAYSEQTDKQVLAKLWTEYFEVEKGVYAQILEDTKNPVKGTVKELSEKFGISLMHMVGFLDGINDSLKVANPIEEMDEETVVSLDYDTELLYKNMVAASADWLYGLEQWDAIFTKERQEELYKEQKRSTTVVNETPKIYPNDPCPCGSGKKYKKCCGKNA